ncbi:hypothetical protein GCM10008097_15770 [Mycetocola manganoxydans]|nr:hypothetical protein GCM10008097_15770 [Mycetocola manganoxydans]
MPAVVVGLLAMHFLIGENMPVAGNAYSIATIGAADYASPAAEQGTVASPTCADVCSPAHDNMVGMACAFALLVSLVLLTLHLFRFRWETFHLVLRSLAAKVTALEPPISPSLHVLSISRT